MAQRETERTAIIMARGGVQRETLRNLGALKQGGTQRETLRVIVYLCPAKVAPARMWVEGA